MFLIGVTFFEFWKRFTDCESGVFRGADRDEFVIVACMFLSRQQSAITTQDIA